jgi:hypothetical protein
MAKLEARVTVLEEGTPEGYRTYDADGAVVIDSVLAPEEWIKSAMQVIRDSSRQVEAATLRDDCLRSVRSRGGDRLYEVIAVMAFGPVETRS